MAGSKHIDKICVVVLVFSLLLTVLFVNGERLGIEMIVDEDAGANAGLVCFTANDLDGDWDASNATRITLDGSGTAGGGAYFYNGDLVISGAGRYVLSGTLDGGSIIVNADDSSKVWLLLDGVAVNCPDDACLRVDEADKVFLTLAEGTVNSFTSGESYSEAALADNTGGAIFAHDDLTINGSGSLNVTAGYKHGIDANDELVITGGTISISAPQDGVHVNDGFRFCAASLTVAAGDDGVHSDTSVYIESGTVRIDECYEGIEAPAIDIAGGEITIYPEDDGLNANGGSGNVFAGFDRFGGGRDFSRFDGDMPGGDFDTQTPRFSGTDGERPDTSGAPRFNGEVPGQSDISGSNGERPSLPDMSGPGGEALTLPGAGAPAGADDAGQSPGEPYIRISGGTITIVNENTRDADGIDSNGSIYITGGSIRISMASGGYALDVGRESGGVMEISGGDIIACGSYAMAEGFDPSSTQPSILYTCSAGAPAGITVALEDLDGSVLISYKAPCGFTCVNLSCPEMELGETYRVVIGEDVEEITLSEVSASYGGAQSGGFGGVRPRDDFMGGGRGGRLGT